MNRWVRMLVLPAVVVIAAGAVAAPPNEPTFRVENPRIDLGDIKAGSDAVATFVFHNDGTEDVKILRAKPS